MIDYLYDGSFEGFLTCVHNHYYKDKAAGIFEERVYQSNMLHPFEVVDTDYPKYQKVYNAINEKAGNEGMVLVYRSFLADAGGKEKDILDYLVMAFKHGKKINGIFSDPKINALRALETKVTAEQHRLLGLLRFSELARSLSFQEDSLLPTQRIQEAILYAEVEPDHNVIELLASHFADRYKNEAFIIHDTYREKAVFYSHNRWDVRPLARDFKEQVVQQGWQSESIYEALWKSYFQSIAIKERTNPRCQKNFMPVRYWKNLTELK